MSYSVCHDIFDPTYIMDYGTLEENEVMGLAYADENGHLVLKLDVSTLSPGFIQSIHDDPFFKLAQDVLFSEAFITDVYEASGQAPPAEPLMMPAGDHPAVFTGEQFVTEIMSPGETIISLLLENVVQ